MSANASIVSTWRCHALTHPSKTAIVFLADGETESQRITYQQLDQRALSLAAHLQAQGACGERALLLLPSGIDYVVAFLGCIYAGVLPVPLYPPTSSVHAERVARVVADCDARWAFAPSNLREGLHARLGVQHMQWVALDAPADACQWAEPSIAAQDIAFLQYTSGSTGDPRGVMVTHGNLLRHAEQLGAAWQLGEHDVAVSWLPLFHDMGLIGSVLQTLLDGSTLVLMPPAVFIQRPARWLEAISRYRGTVSFAPNFAYELCSSLSTTTEPLDLSSWRVACNAAEPVHADAALRFVRRYAGSGLAEQTVAPAYGLAEATLIVTARVPGEGSGLLWRVNAEAFERGNAVDEPDAQVRALDLVSCGRPLLAGGVRVVDAETCVPCEPGAVGEVWLRGDCIASGYWQRPDRTAHVFGARLAGEEGSWLRTGDLGVLHDGQLYIAGRLKDLIIVRGQNHHPADLEHSALRSHSALMPGHAAAFSVDVNGQECVVVAAELRRNARKHFDAGEILHCVRTALAQQHELSLHALVLLRPGGLPITSSGKVQRQACRHAYLAGSLEALSVWQDTAAPEAGDTSPSTQAWLAQWVARRKGLAVEQVDPRQPFTSFGMDSLELVEMSGDLAQWLGRPLEPTLLFNHPDIARLSAHLDGAQATAPAAVSAVAHEPLAVVGMACRFPGADTPDAFWELLNSGADAIREVPASRWPATQDDPGVRRAGFIDGVDEFDAAFFGIAPREARSMDPQQRLLLQCAWHALQDAGIEPRSLAGSRTGVFIGICNGDYRDLMLTQGDPVDAHYGTGTAFSIAANRISYTLDLRGPSVVVDTACSSSLVALHQARLSLLAGECELAIVGGVNLLLSPHVSRVFRQAQMLSRDGRCKTFDADADGYVRGEGCGVIVLARDSLLRRDGLHARALLRGSAINQDGRSNGITAPNGLAQQAVMRDALAAAGVEAAQVGYVEAHGTGTPLGDPIEADALAAVYGAGDAAPLWVGSAKPHIGHLEAAAGIAGFIKAVLALQHRQVPPQLHLHKLNPRISPQGTRWAVPIEPQAWPVAPGGRIAGISSFGFGGSNAHAIVAEAPQDEPVARPRLPLQVFARERHWFAARKAEFSLLGRRLAVAGSPNIHFESRWTADDTPLMTQHRVYGVPTLPGTAIIEWMLAGAAQATQTNTGDWALQAVQFKRLFDAPVLNVQLCVQVQGDELCITGYSLDDESGEWREHVTARARRHESAASPPRLEKQALERQVLSGCYEHMARRGVDYGEVFRGLVQCWRGAQCVLARIELPAGNAESALLDACLQPMHLLAGDGHHLLVPSAIEQLHIRRALPSQVWCELRWQGDPTGARFTVDAAIYDDEGACLATVQGFQATPAPPELVGRAGTGRKPTGHVTAWEPLEAAAAASQPGGTWLVFCSDASQADAWQAALAAQGEDAVAVGAMPAFEQALARMRQERQPLRGVLLIGGAAQGGDPADAAFAQARRGFEVMQHVLAGDERPELVICTRGLHRVAAQDSGPCEAALADSTLHGLAKAVIVEYPRLKCVQVDLDPRGPAHPAADVLRALRASAGSGHVALRDGRCFEAHLRDAPLPAEDAGKVAVRDDAAYLVTGGLGGLGLRVAAWLVDHGARHLVLAGRGTQEADAALAALRARGARVLALPVDVSQEADVAALMQQMQAQMPPLRGVFHAAGVLDDALLCKLDWPRVQAVMQPKLRGAWLLHRFTQAMPLDFFVLFSSLTSLVGAAGQSNYVMANSGLDAIAQHRQSLGLPALAIQWGAWAEVGMVARGGLVARVEHGGVGAMAPAAALQAMHSALGSGLAQIGIAAIDWQAFHAAHTRELLYTLLPRPQQAAPAAGTNVLAGCEPEHLKQRLLALLLERSAAVLDLSASHQADLREGFADVKLNTLGLDSLMAMELRDRLQAELAVDMPLQMFLGGATAAEVVEQLHTQVLLQQLSMRSQAQEDEVWTL